jgi:diacylglycerol kinase
MKAQSQLATRVKSFGYAFQGIATLLRTQVNARIHAVATALVVLAAWYWQVSALDWCVLLLAIAMVFSAEAVNTALEILCDKVEPEQHAAIKQVKDVAAAAVLLAAIAAAIIGLIVFVPRIFS